MTNLGFILGIETSTTAGSVAVVRSTSSVFNAEWSRDRSHAEVLTPQLEKAAAAIGGWSKLTAIAVGIGPGSFTGIRVAVNAARTLAWNLGLPLIPFRSTDVMLAQAQASGLIERDCVPLALINAQMGHHFAAWTDEAPIAVPETDLAAHMLTHVQSMAKPARAVVLIGQAGHLVAPELRRQLAGKSVAVVDGPKELDFPLATMAARLALSLVANNEPSTLVLKYPWRATQPLYIRGSGAEEKSR